MSGMDLNNYLNKADIVAVGDRSAPGFSAILTEPPDPEGCMVMKHGHAAHYIQRIESAIRFMWEPARLSA